MVAEIVSNNPLVWKRYPHCTRVEGSSFDVLSFVRCRVHVGYALPAHPLAGNARLCRNPYRSVVLGPRTNEIRGADVECIEDAHERVRESRIDTSTQSGNDYALIDSDLLESVLLNI